MEIVELSQMELKQLQYAISFYYTHVKNESLDETRNHAVAEKVVHLATIAEAAKKIGVDL